MSIAKVKCQGCRKMFVAAYITKYGPPPVCPKCMVKALHRAIEAAEQDLAVSVPVAGGGEPNA